MSALFHGYLSVTGGADSVDQVLSEVRDLIHTSPTAPSASLSLEGSSSPQPVNVVTEALTQTPLVGSEDAESLVLPPANVNGVVFQVEGVDGCEGLNRLDGCNDCQNSVDNWEEEQQLSEEQHRREVNKLKEKVIH